MDSISSSEFRRIYASLKQATQVTVNGHVIGEWWPRDLLPQLDKTGTRMAGDYAFPRDFRPAPKPSQKGK